MFFRILKKDIIRKKSMNFILLIFIMMATIFLASSVNNLISISTSLNYFFDKAKVPDIIIAANERGDNDKLIKWFNTSKLINSYDIDKNTMLTKSNVKIKRGKKLKSFEPFGQIILGTEPKKYGKVFDENGEDIKLKSGEIAFSLLDKNKNKLKIGDKVIITLGGIKKEFKIKNFTKDAIFGSTMMDMKRILISNEDYKAFKSYKKASLIYNYFIKCKDSNATEKEFMAGNHNTIINFDKSMLNTTFILDMVPSGILIIMSICLILIAFLILRFTIIFTLQDDFKEIGVMKAIGLKNFDIRNIYLIKYFGLAIIGVILGFAGSFPFGSAFLNESSGNILMKPSAGNVSINILCSLFIAFLVILFCYTCTRKLNKTSAIDAIRNGSNGESFKGKWILKLRNCKNIKISIFIALNDIICDFKRYIALILAFCIGTILIIIPINAINTFKDKNLVNLFGLKYSDVFIETDKMDQYAKQGTKADYIKDINKLTQSFKSNGVNISLYGELLYRFKIYGEGKDNALQLMAMQVVNSDNNNYAILKGEMPVEENEIALTENVAKKFKVSIGDTVYVQIGNDKKPMIVTGLYESTDNMGRSVRLSPKLNVDFKYLAQISSLQGNFKEKGNPEIYIKKLKKAYPGYIFETGQKYLSRYIGGTMEQLDSMKNLIVFVVLGINGLVTILMMKTFISKEKGEIALLKSIGFRNSSIRLWQSARISFMLVLGIALGIISAYILGPIMVNQIFGIMGIHNLRLKIKPLEVFVFYPLLLLVITTTVAYINAGEVNKIDLKEINNIE